MRTDSSLEKNLFCLLMTLTESASPNYYTLIKIPAHKWNRYKSSFISTQTLDRKTTLPEIFLCIFAFIENVFLNNFAIFIESALFYILVQKP